MSIKFSDKIKDIDNWIFSKSDYIKMDLLNFKKELIKENTVNKLQEITLEQSIFQLSQIKSELWPEWKFYKDYLTHPSAVKIIFLVQRIFAWTEFDCGLIDWVRGKNTISSIKKFNKKYIWKWNWVLWPKITEKIIETFGKVSKHSSQNKQQLNDSVNQVNPIENNIEINTKEIKPQKIKNNVSFNLKLDKIKTKENKVEEQKDFVWPPNLENLFEEKYKDLIAKYPKMIRFYDAMKKTNFFPKPEVIEYFFQMWTQESSLTWNPRIWIKESRKKKEIKEKLSFAIKSLNSTIWKVWLSLIDDEDKKSISSLIISLEKIYQNDKSSEYDLFLWMNNLSDFINKKEENILNLINLIKFLNLPFYTSLNFIIYYSDNKIRNIINHTPNSFGIWQVNADLFLEKIKKNWVIKKFPEISNIKDEKLQREELIKALCWESKILGRDRTMELIIEWHLKPRYFNHNRWKFDDLKYMVVENLTWEMSTYYSGIQKRLNEILELKPPIKTDWILWEKKKYSNEYDFEKIKENWATFKAIFQFIKSSDKFRDNSPEKLIKELYDCNNWDKLSKNTLYKAIMWDKVWERFISKDMWSSISNQTAEEYFENIKKKNKKPIINRDRKIEINWKSINYEYNDYKVLDEIKKFYDNKEKKLFPKKWQIEKEWDEILKTNKYWDHYTDEVIKLLENNWFSEDNVITKAKVDNWLEKIWFKKVNHITQSWISYWIWTDNFEINEKYSYLMEEAEKENRIITKIFQNKIKEIWLPENFKILPMINSLIRDKERNDELKKQGFNTDPNSSHMHWIAFDYWFERFWIFSKKENSNDWYYTDTLTVLKNENINNQNNMEIIQQIKSILKIAQSIMAKIIDERHKSWAIIFTNETKTKNPHYHINVNPKYYSRNTELTNLWL